MSDAIQLPPILPPVPSPALGKRVSTAPVAPAAATDQAKQQPAQPAPAQAAPPPVNVEPSTYLTITRDNTANTFVYRSVDAKSGDVVWQYPVEQVLRMAHRLRDLEGLDSHQVDQRV